MTNRPATSVPSSNPAAAGASQPRYPGVEIIGSGHAVPKRTLTNSDLERMMDTTDEWIVQRTGIHTRHVIDRGAGEGTTSLSISALRLALADAKVDPSEIDLVIVATMTPEMSCPPAATRIAFEVGCKRAGAFDISAACCGFVFSLNTAHDLIRAGTYRTIALVGADCLSTLMDYSTAGRGTAIIFGDAAAAVILRATDNQSKGILAQSIHVDGERWSDIYVPMHDADFPKGVAPEASKHGHVQMNGAGVFKFAVGTFPQLIQDTLDRANLTPDQVDIFVCHQSNARILVAARERFGLSDDKLYINIDRYGNTVAASVPLCLDELRRAGRVRPGMRVMFLAFGGGLSWGSSLWQM